MDTTVEKTPDVEGVSKDLRRAAGLVEDGRVEDALELVRGIQASLDSAGLACAHVHVALAWLCSVSGAMEQALLHATTALDLEPANPGCVAAFTDIVAHANRVLTTTYPWNERGLLLFKLVASTGLANDEVLDLVTQSGRASKGMATATERAV